MWPPCFHVQGGHIGPPLPFGSAMPLPACPHPPGYPAGWFATRYNCAIILRMAPQPSNTRPLILGTLSFAVSFAAWGLISAFAPRFREMFSLTATQTALLVAVP